MFVTNDVLVVVALAGEFGVARTPASRRDCCLVCANNHRERSRSWRYDGIPGCGLAARRGVQLNAPTPCLKHDKTVEMIRHDNPRIKANARMVLWYSLPAFFCQRLQRRLFEKQPAPMRADRDEIHAGLV